MRKLRSRLAASDIRQVQLVRGEARLSSNAFARPVPRRRAKSVAALCDWLAYGEFSRSWIVLRSGSDLNSVYTTPRSEFQDHPIDQSRALQLRCVAAAGNHSELKAREVLDRILHGI